MSCTVFFCPEYREKKKKGGGGGQVVEGEAFSRQNRQGTIATELKIDSGRVSPSCVYTHAGVHTRTRTCTHTHTYIYEKELESILSLETPTRVGKI